MKDSFLNPIKALRRSRVRRGYKEAWIGIAIITLVTTLVYLNSLRVPFNFDDVAGIINNPSIHLETISLAELKDSINNNRPISNLSFAINYYFGGLNVPGYHIVNVMIHCLTAVLVYIFFLKTLAPSSSIFPLLGSLLWAVHPVHTQAVTYIVQRMTELAAMFFMLSLILYLQGSRSSGQRRIWLFLAATGAGLLGMGSKETAITLPFVILLHEFYFRAKFDFSLMKRLLKYWLPVFAVTLVFLVAYFEQRGGLIHGLYNLLTESLSNESFTGPQRLLTESRVIMFYLSLLIFPLPSRLNLDHDFALSTSLVDPLSTLFSFISIFGMILYSLWIAKKYPVVSFGILWFFINLTLESTFLKLDIIFEHRLYLPSIGVFLALSWILMKVAQFRILAPVGRPQNSTFLDTSDIHNQGESQPWLTEFVDFLRNKWKRFQRIRMIQVGLLLITFGLLGFYSGATILRNALWQDDIRLWMDIAKKSPHKARVHNNLGLLYLSRGELEPAGQEFEQALRLSPNFLLFRHNLATVYLGQGKTQEAIRVYQEALQIDPFNAMVYEKMGKIYSKSGRLDLATIALEKAVSLDPGRAMTNSLLGQVYQKSGYTEKAAMAYEQALRLIKQEVFKPRISHPLTEPAETPDKPSLQYELGQIYEELEKPALAIQHYQEAIRIVTAFLPARVRLLLLYKKTGRTDLAEAEYRKILEEDPTFTIAQDDPSRTILQK